MSPALQAIAAVQTLNGAELGGRRISVREDREDRDVKQFTEGEEGGNGGFRRGGGRRGRGRGPRPPVEGDPSGYQVRCSCWCCDMGTPLSAQDSSWEAMVLLAVGEQLAVW